VRAAARTATDAELRAALLQGSLSDSDLHAVRAEQDHRSFMGGVFHAAARAAGYERQRFDLSARGGFVLQGMTAR
jgi:hypothetical protein